MSPVVLFACCIGLFSFSPTERQRNGIRTDGYYVYDNGQDSFILMRNAEAVYRETVEMLTMMGEPPQGEPEGCAPKGKAYLPGSPFLHYLTFFSDTT